MPYSTSPSWLQYFVQASAVLRSGRTSEFYRGVRAGRFHRLAEGVYLPTALWLGLDDDERFLTIVHAANLASRDGLVFSHMSAAALWRLPIVGAWPARPEVTVGTNARGPVRRAFTARQYPLPPAVEIIDGLSVTPLARTVVDVARTNQLSTSVAMMDHALRRKPPSGNGIASATVSMAQLTVEMAGATSVRGLRRCRDADELADGRSGSPGESLSRVGMFLLGLPAPVLQHEFRDAEGVMFADFWWPEFNLIGEFDGLGKYLGEEFLAGRSTADAVVAEKKRENRLRALGPRVTRWGWDAARSLFLLGENLRGAGLR
jgi:hypothetical protein